MEVSSSAHHWARKRLAMGLDARIVSAQLAAPYRGEGHVGKNDANDAAAICEAGSRPHMRLVPVKRIEQQSLLCVHRLREGVKADRTACINRIRGLLLRYGIAVATGARALQTTLHDILADAGNELNGLARMTLQRAHAQWRELDEHLAWCDARLAAHAADSADVRPAVDLMGVGPITASAAVATVGDFKQFDSGAKSVVNTAHTRTDPISRWALALKERSAWQKTVLALANKNACILWAVMAREQRFDRHHISTKPAGATQPPRSADPSTAAMA